MGALNGDHLKKARERLGVSQEELSKIIGEKQQHLSRWERGLHDPSTEVVRKMAVALGVSTDYLLGLIDDTGDSEEEKSLSPIQRKLLRAIDNGQVTETFETLAMLTKGDQK